MGGYGSGRQSNRATTDECIRIRLSDLKRLGMVERDCICRQVLKWRRNGRISAQLTLVTDVRCREPYPCLKITGLAFDRHIDCLVWLDSQPMPFGGERWYALCPMTGRRCTTLVLPPGTSHFASVSGWKVAYGSQRECKVHRAYRAIERASSRLAELSKYARQPTRDKLRARVRSRYTIVEQEIDRLHALSLRSDRLR